jgi:hypothetical protein
MAASQCSRTTPLTPHERYAKQPRPPQQHAHSSRDASFIAPIDDVQTGSIRITSRFWPEAFRLCLCERRSAPTITAISTAVNATDRRSVRNFQRHTECMHGFRTSLSAPCPPKTPLYCCAAFRSDDGTRLPPNKSERAISARVFGRGLVAPDAIFLTLRHPGRPARP